MDNIDETRIEQLVERFMAGETSLEEEDLLYRYFSGDNVAENLKQYKELFTAFAIFAADNDYTYTKESDTAQEKTVGKPTEKKIKPPVLRWLSYAAVSAAVAVTLFISQLPDRHSPLAGGIYEGSYVIVNRQYVDDEELVARKVAETLAWSEIVEREAEAIPTAAETETCIINSVSDPELKKEIEKMLTE